MDDIRKKVMACDDVKENTKKKLINYFNNITKELNDSNFKEKLNDIEYIKSYLDRYSSLSTQETILGCIMSIHKKCNNELIDDISQIESLFKEIRILRVIENSKQKPKKYVPWNELIFIRDCFDKDSIDYLLFCLYTMIPPRRRDYLSARGHSCIFVNELPETLDPTTSYVVLNEYITLNLVNRKELKGKETRYTITLKNDNYEYLDKVPFLCPEELNQIIHTSFEHNKRTHLIPGSNYIVKKHKYKNITIGPNVFRHSFSTEISKMNLSDYYYNLIAKDHGDKRIEQFREYRVINESESENESQLDDDDDDDESDEESKLVIATNEPIDIKYISDLASEIEVLTLDEKLNIKEEELKLQLQEIQKQLQEITLTRELIKKYS